MRYSNFHTHTTFCDGKNTAEEMVRAAISAGCPALGFSGHSYLDFDDSFCMSRENTRLYRVEIARLRALYAENIEILCGLEQDVCSPPPDAAYDYLIGAVHCLFVDGEYFSVDYTAEEQQRAVREGFGGDWYAFAAAYYEEMATVYARTGCHLVAHFDLVTKFNENGRFFDENDRRYRHAALAALEEVAKTPVALEINTGAIRRGYRTGPYPAPFILAELARRDLPVLLSADAHDVGGITFGFNEAEALARQYSLTVLPHIAAIGK